MSDQSHLIGQVMSDFTPISEDHPVAQETYDAVKAALEARGQAIEETTTELQELQFSGLEVGIIKPGDTLLLSTREPMGLEHIHRLKERLADELPGVTPVILDGLRVEAIFRKDDHG